MIKVIGLTGGIGSGKSAVAQMIREQGHPVMDADVMARQVSEPGRPAYHDIARAWPEVVGGQGPGGEAPEQAQIDRKRLAQIVFADPDSRRRLEAITHPRIRAEVAAQTAALAAAGHRLAFLEAALLVETGLYRELDGLLVVDAAPETRIERVVRRDRATREAVLARMAAQLPMPDKLRVADHVIDNGGALAETRRQVLSLLASLAVPAPPG